ncbi:UNVERIFIED_CONTAM: hypothetical protein HDU68_009962 [Siphonaria sp. JEL0065]|nr:hypothetical protein HDU68_009962 [Siphonaria sp. JEL0065]
MRQLNIVSAVLYAGEFQGVKMEKEISKRTIDILGMTPSFRSVRHRGSRLFKELDSQDVAHCTMCTTSEIWSYIDEGQLLPVQPTPQHIPQVQPLISNPTMFSTAPRATSSTNATSKPGAAQTKVLSPTTPRKVGSNHTPSLTIAPAAEPKSTKLSNRSTPKAILDLGVGSHHKTAFSAAYSKGGFPCRLEHGSVKHKISWSQPVSTLAYNPLFVTLMEGLRETRHPFLFLVPHALKELILAPNARSKIEPIMPQSVRPLRHALLSKEKSTILAALDTVHSLGTCMGACMLPYLAALLPPIALHSHSRDPQIKDAVIVCLQGVESGIAFNSNNRDNDGECKRVEVQSASGAKEKKLVNVGEWIGAGGGDRGVGGADGAEALKLIKSKIPTYSSVFG